MARRSGRPGAAIGAVVALVLGASAVVTVVAHHGGREGAERGTGDRLHRPPEAIAARPPVRATAAARLPGEPALADRDRDIPVRELSSGLDSPYGVAFSASGGLWVANESADTVVEYAPGDLARGLLAPEVTLSNGATAALSSPTGLAFDHQGDLWVANSASGTVVEYTPDQLAKGAVSPHVTLSTGRRASLDGPEGIAFDASGDLWVANSASGTVVEYAAGQLLTGAPLPRVTLSPRPGPDGGPDGLAFDSTGDLWVADGPANSVVEYTPGQLRTGAPLPHVVLLTQTGKASASGSLSSPHALAFDAAGDLWVVNQQGNSLVEYARPQLTASGAPVPRVTITSAPPGTLSVPGGIAIDRGGDLWVTNEENNNVVAYSPRELVSGDPVPTATVSGLPGSFDWPFGVAFDAAGDLWVANYSGDSVVEYGPAQLASGPGTPLVTITSNRLGSLDGPDALALDRAGDLWVANYDVATGADNLVEYTPGQLRTGSPTPWATITPDSADSLDEPEGLSFDPSGDLWVANYGDNTLVEFAPRQLVSGSPTPRATLSAGTRDSLNEPDGLAFDRRGDLWVANYNSDTVVEYRPGQLATGAPAPAATITAGTSGSLDAPNGLAFDAQGDLWVANYNADTVVEYTRAELARRAPAPAPATISAGPVGGLDGPDGLAFDSAGDLWVVNFNNNTVVEYLT